MNNPNPNELINYHCPNCGALNPEKLYREKLYRKDLPDFIVGCEFCISEVDQSDYLAELENEKPFYDVSEAVDFMEGKLDG